MLTTSNVIRPNGNLFISDHLTDESSAHQRGSSFKISAEEQTALCYTRYIGYLGLCSIARLHTLLPEDDESKPDDHVIISLLAFTSASDPWTTQISHDLANHLLSIYRVKILQPEFIKKSVLTSFIRPLFSASKPKAITTSGYAAISSYRPREPHDFNAWNQTSKPWRVETCYAPTVLSWAVSHASQEVILSIFHLIVPPILILIDSPNTTMKLKGLKILDIYVEKLTSKHFEQTGLGAVIEDAIHPILLYLPPITPLSESLVLLPAAFKSYFTLLEVRFLSPILTDTRNQDQVRQKQKLASLTRLLRQAIIPAYSHTSLSSTSDPIIKKIILDQIPPLVRALGVHSVAHLQALLQLTEDSLLDPFATASLPAMFAALRSLREIILCAWPRLSEERGRREVIRMMLSAWRKIRDEKDNPAEARRKDVLVELKIVGKLFVKAVEASGEVDLSCDLNPLFEADESLKELFGIE